MNNSSPLEPGILHTFRISIGIRLALVFVSLVYLGYFSDWSFVNKYIYLMIVIIADAALLFIYLSLPKLITTIKQHYLPIAIVWSTLGPMMQLYLGYFLIRHEPIQFSTYFMTPLPFLVLFIPLVIIAWQYPSKYVIYFCVGTFLCDGIFALQVYKTSLLSFLILIGIAFVRTTLFLLVGNMITYLMKVQREQRLSITENYNHLANYSLTMEQLAISRERNRVARELHDVLAHTVSGVAVELEGVRTNIKNNPEKASELVDHSLTALRQGLYETRQTLQNLRNIPFEEAGLVASIRSLVETFTFKQTIYLDLQIDGEDPCFSSEINHCFYRVAQEALNNIAAHSRATRVILRIIQNKHILKLSIEDDGIGFDPLAVDQVSSYGLLGMYERAELIHAQLTVKSKPGYGTIIGLVYGAES
jgi:signal transduction histidine kinase